MMYQKNGNIEIMDLEDGEQVAFDPDSGDTHFLNPVASDILRLLAEPMDGRALAAALSREYDAGPEEIEPDILPFLDELHQKNLLITL